MSAEGIITLGIGSAPGNLMWFFTLGLYSSEEVAEAEMCECAFSPYVIPFVSDSGEHPAVETTTVTFRYPPASIITSTYRK